MSNLPPPAYQEDVDAPPPYTFDIKQPLDSEKFEESFKIDRPKYNDVAFTFIFIACSVVFAWIFGYSLVNLNPSSSPSDLYTIAATNSQKPIASFIFVGITIPVLGSVISLLLAYLFPVVFVFISYLLVPISLIISCAVFLINGQLLPALFSAIFTAFTVFFVCFNMNRLRFTATVLKIVIKVMTQYPSTLGVAFFSTLASGGLSLVYFVMSMVIYASRVQIDDKTCDASQYSKNGDSDLCVSNTSFVLEIYTLFYGYFLFEVMANLTHVVISGIYGTWYFFGSKAIKPKNPALGSLKRSLTYSFGSICLGSLIVAGIRTLRVVLSIMKNKVQERRSGRGSYSQIMDSDSDNASTKALLCALYIFLNIMEWFAAQIEAWTRFFNKYAYSNLALFGKSYVQSSRDTFELLRYKGIMILISDSLVETTLTFYSIIVSILSCLLMFMYISFVGLNKGVDSTYLVIGLVLELVISYFVSKITMSVIRSGFITFLVALCINPEIYENDHPTDFNQLIKYHPEIYSSLKTPLPEYV